MEQNFFSRLFGIGASPRYEDAQVVEKAPKRSAQEIYEIYHKDPLKQHRVLSLQMALTLAITTIEDAQDAQWPLPDVRKVAYETYQQLRREGKGESDYAKRQLALAGDYPTLVRQAREAHQLLYFMKSVWAQFGNQVLIMKSTDFAKVCDKYHLVCGNISDYSGEIPLFNKQEIDAAKVTFKGYSRDKSNPVYVQSTFPTELTWGGSILWRSWTSRVDIKDHGWFIAAPKGAFANKTEFVFKGDPFVFTVSELGYILIHSKWGAEAEDATIKRYEQLRDAIIGKGDEA